MKKGGRHVRGIRRKKQTGAYHGDGSRRHRRGRGARGCGHYVPHTISALV